MSDGMIFCRACGGSVHRTAPLCPHCGAPQSHGGAGDGIERTFGSSVSMCLGKYVTFAGRAPRAEYWWFVLFCIVVQVAIGIVGLAIGRDGANILSGIASLALFLPSLSVLVRRLHDVDRSGWWFWIVLVPVVGWIILLVWACTRGTHGDNRYGPENGATT